MKSLGEIVNNPCKRCSKTIRYDYGGICLDCADELGISELFEKNNNKEYQKNLAKAVKAYGTEPNVN